MSFYPFPKILVIGMAIPIPNHIFPIFIIFSGPVGSAVAFVHSRSELPLIVRRFVV